MLWLTWRGSAKNGIRRGASSCGGIRVQISNEGCDISGKQVSQHFAPEPEIAFESSELHMILNRFIPNVTPFGRTRQEFLWEAGGGFAGLGLIDLLSWDGFFAAVTL